LEKLNEQSDLESYEYEASDDSDSIRRIKAVNTSYPVEQKMVGPNKVERGQLYSASVIEIDEKKPEMENFPQHLEYTYLHGDKSFPIIISSKLSEREKMLLLQVLEKRKGAIAWKMSDINRIGLSYCTHKILMEDDYKSVIRPQRYLNLKVQDVVKNEIVKLLDSGLIYPFLDSSWVSPIHVVPKKGGMTVVLNDNNELIPSRTRSGNISSRSEMPQNNIQSVGYNPKNWSEKHDDALWAFRTAYKTPTGCTPFRLVYGKACHLLVEIKHKAYWVLKQCNMDLTAATKSCFIELNELMELRDGAYENTRIYKERTKRWHDSRLRGDKNFKVGDKVLLFNSRFKMHPGKLKSRWYGPNVVKTVYPYGTIEIIDRNEISFKVNG
ncbi:reverse transcriptase domain-containing protein, partial [Tanacetum coccineum]